MSVFDTDPGTVHHSDYFYLHLPLFLFIFFFSFSPQLVKEQEQPTQESRPRQGFFFTRRVFPDCSRTMLLWRNRLVGSRCDWSFSTLQINIHLIIYMPDGFSRCILLHNIKAFLTTIYFFEDEVDM